MSERPTTRSQAKAGPEAGPRTFHHTPDGEDQVPAPAGARSESTDDAPAASPVPAWLQSLGFGSDRKQGSSRTESDAAAQPASPIADPMASEMADISAETSGSAETTNADEVAADQLSTAACRAAHACIGSDDASAGDGAASAAMPAAGDGASANLSVPGPRVT